MLLKMTLCGSALCLSSLGDFQTNSPSLASEMPAPGSVEANKHSSSVSYSSLPAASYPLGWWSGDSGSPWPLWEVGVGVST